MRRPSWSSGMGYQIHIKGDGAVKKPHGRPVCQAGSALEEGWMGHEPHGRPVCRAGSVLGERMVEKNPTVVQCVVPDPYERGKRGGKDKMPTVVQGGVPGPLSGKGGGGAERRRDDG